MSSGADFFLKKTLGEDFMESLQKFELWKPGTKSVIDHEEIRTALQIVPRTVMSFLIHHLSSMNIGDNKAIQLPVAAPAMLHVTKHERDVYSGFIEQGGKVVTDFKFRSIPGVGLIVMSSFELYNTDNLVNEAPKQEDSVVDKVQKLIEERLAMNDLVNSVVDKKMEEREAVHKLMLARLGEELQKEREFGSHMANQVAETARSIDEITQIAKQSANSDEYMRGMANGLEVANSVASKKEPEFVEPPKKVRPLKEFLAKREGKKEFSISLSKGETVSCPDCKKNIFDGQVFSGCVCLGDDMERKVFIKKSEDGIKVRFGRGWDQENIEMLLEVLRRKRG